MRISEADRLELETYNRSIYTDNLYRTYSFFRLTSRLGKLVRNYACRILRSVQKCLADWLGRELREGVDVRGRG